MNVDVSKVLPKEINFSKDAKEFVVEFNYLWLPSLYITTVISGDI